MDGGVEDSRGWILDSRGGGWNEACRGEASCHPRRLFIRFPAASQRLPDDEDPKSQVLQERPRVEFSLEQVSHALLSFLCLVHFSRARVCCLGPIYCFYLFHYLFRTEEARRRCQRFSCRKRREALRAVSFSSQFPIACLPACPGRRRHQVAVKSRSEQAGHVCHEAAQAAKAAGHTTTRLPGCCQGCQLPEG